LFFNVFGNFADFVIAFCVLPVSCTSLLRLVA